MRVAQSERYDLFFLLDMDRLPVSRKIIQDFISIYDEKDADKIINELNDTERMPFFISELIALTDSVPYDRIPLLINVLFKNRMKLVGEEIIVFATSTSMRAEYCIERLLLRLNTTKERFEILLDQVETDSLEVFSSVCSEINHIELTHGRLAAKSENASEQIIELEQLEKLEKAFCKNIKKLNKNNKLIENIEFNMMFYLWKCFDRVNAEKYIKTVLKNKHNCLLYICRMSGKWSGTGGIGWSYHVIAEETYIEKEDLIEIINKYDKNNMLVEFTELELIQIASFVLNYGKDEDYHVNQQQAKELIIDWQNK